MTQNRVIVTGSRSWDLGAFAGRVVAGLVRRHGPALLIVHGACPSGVDDSIDRAARAAGVDVERHPADWSLGRRAGPLRNQAMADAGASACIAFSPNLAASRGTADMVRRAVAAGIPTWHIAGEGGKPVRINPSPAKEPPRCSR